MWSDPLFKVHAHCLRIEILLEAQAGGLRLGLGEMLYRKSLFSTHQRLDVVCYQKSRFIVASDVSNYCINSAISGKLNIFYCRPLPRECHLNFVLLAKRSQFCKLIEACKTLLPISRCLCLQFVESGNRNN